MRTKGRVQREKDIGMEHRRRPCSYGETMRSIARLTLPRHAREWRTMFGRAAALMLGEARENLLVGEK